MPINFLLWAAHSVKNMDAEITIVSGLPRSGTSLMMQMLARGGMEIADDGQRTADEDNPRGYCEFEPVKRLQQDASWVPGLRGQAVKIISQLLFSLPATEQYAVILMQRDLEEVLASQQKMLQRQGHPTAARDVLRKAFSGQLKRLDEWLPRQSNIRVLRIDYAEVIADSANAAEQVNQFLNGRLNVSAMSVAADPRLYRNRAPG